MINLHFFLDCRATAPDAPAPLKLAVAKRSQTAFVLTGISLRPAEWDAKGQKVVEHPRRKILNSDLARMRAEAEDLLRPMIYNGELADLSATQIRDIVKSHFYGHINAVKLSEVYLPACARKSPGTAAIYEGSWRRLLLWKPSAESMGVDTFSASFVRDFAEWLNTHYKKNTVSTTLRCLRSAWNEAAASGKVSGNPFAGIDTRDGETEGRDLSLAQLRTLWRSTPADERESLALDYFRLSFLLRAANPIDLFNARLSDIKNGRLYYHRQKTGKAISAKIEPEAAEIISRRQGGGRIFHHSRSMDNLLYQANKGLKSVSSRLGLPPVTMYWARHTLASLLFEQGGTMDIVSAILSHSLGGAKVTATYVAVREARLDEAMRSVIDAVVNE